MKEVRLDPAPSESDEPGERKIKIFSNFLKALRLESGENYEEMKRKREASLEKSIGRIELDKRRYF